MGGPDATGTLRVGCAELASQDQKRLQRVRLVLFRTMTFSSAPALLRAHRIPWACPTVFWAGCYIQSPRACNPVGLPHGHRAGCWEPASISPRLVPQLSAYTLRHARPATWVVTVNWHPHRFASPSESHGGHSRAEATGGCEPSAQGTVGQAHGIGCPIGRLLAASPKDRGASPRDWARVIKRNGTRSGE